MSLLPIAVILLLSLLLQAPGSAQPADGPGTLSREGVVLHYRELGRGRPLLVLSGGPGFSSEYMRPVAERLSRTCRCILLDQRGTGRSHMEAITPQNMTLALCIADLDALRESLHLERWSLLGHSWGGMLAMAYAAAHPDRVDALLLIGPGGTDLSFRSYFGDNIRMRLLPEDLEASTHWHDPTVLAADPRRAAVEQLKAMLPGYVYNRAFVAGLRQAFTPEGFTSEVFRTLMADLEKQGYDLHLPLQRFHRPTLILQGRQDPVGEATALRTHEIIAGSTLRWVEKSGHFPWVEQPEATYTALEEFLRAQ